MGHPLIAADAKTLLASDSLQLLLTTERFAALNDDPKLAVQQLIAQVHVSIQAASGLLRKGQFVLARAALSSAAEPVQSLADLFQLNLDAR